MQCPDDISLAQWSLIDEWRAGKWKTLDIPRLAREDFDLNGVEFVNTLFELPTESYLKQLKQNAADHGITMVLIMVDDEGDGSLERTGVGASWAFKHSPFSSPSSAPSRFRRIPATPCRRKSRKRRDPHNKAGLFELIFA